MFRPTYFEPVVTEIKVEDITAVDLQLFDTQGQDDYDRLRPLAYPDTNVILICFSIVEPETLENVEKKWIPEILHFLSDPVVPYILVGCKNDLRQDWHTIELKRRPSSLIASEQAQKFSEKIGASRYMEVSAKSGNGLYELFDLAAKLSLESRSYPRSSKCLVL